MKRIEIAIALVFSTVILISCKDSNKIENTFGEPEMNGVEQAIQQEIFMTRDPHTNTVPVERLHAANAYTKMVQQARLTGVAVLTWAERGPNNVGGRTRSVMIDKRDATGNTVFAASVSGGLFKTTNFTSASTTWAPVNDLLPNLAITCLLQDRTNGSIMYAGTGEGWFNIDAARGSGIFKSTDGGTTWNILASTIKTTPADSTFEYVQDLAQDSSGNIYASLRNLTGFARGVKRSANGGTSWVQVLGAPLVGFNTGRAGDLEVASNGDVYATLGLTGDAITNKSVVMKSSFATHGANAGNENTWVEITPVRGLPTRRSELAVAKSDPQRLYLLMQDSASDQVIGTYRSFNGGTSWDSVASAPALNNGAVSQVWYNLIAAVDPNNANILIVGGLNLAKSTDAGVTWSTISTSANVHVDQHALVFDGSSKLIAGNDGGIYYSTDVNNATPTFANKNNGFNCTQYYGVDLHPTTTNYFLAGAQDNGTQKFSSAGINSTTNATGGDGGWPHIDQNNGGNLQITSNTGNRYNISNNGGVSFSFASTVFNDRGQFINPTDLDDQNDILYCGDEVGKYFFITNLTGTPSGTQVTVGAFGSREVTFVKVDPVTPTTVWMGLSPTVGTLRPMVVKLTSANSATPVLNSQGLVGTVNGAAISSIDIDPTNTNHVIATLSNYGVTSVWESTDGGATFNSIEGNLPDMPIWWGMFAPAEAQLNGATGGNGGIILGTELGVWTTSVINGTSTQWATSGTSLPNARVYMLKYRSADNVLVAATHGRGLFTTTLTLVPPPPANDDCAGATTLTSALSCSNTTGTLVNATASTGLPAGCQAAGIHNDVWYKFVATNTTHTVTISGQGASVTNPEIQLYSGTCGSLTSIVCGPTTLTSSLLSIGTTYYIRVSNIGTSPTSNGGFSICITNPPPPPANDDCPGATTLTSAVSCSNTTGTLVNATASTGLPAGCAAAGVHNDVWYKFVATNTTHTVTISGQGASFTNPEIQLYSGTCGSLTSIVCGTTTLSSSVLSIGATYYIRVSNIGSSPTSNGGFSICITNPPPPPANDDCAGAITLTTPASCSNTTGTLVNTTASTGIPAGCASAGIHNDVWYNFVATGTSHTVTISGQGVNVTNPEIQLFSGTCGTLTSIGCGTTTLTSSALTTGTTYYIRVSNIGSSPSSNGGFNICVTNPAPTGVPNIPNTKDFIKYISVENNQLQVVVGKLQTQTMTMQLFDMNGRLMMQRRQRYENTMLDLSRYQSGSYILKVMGDKNERFVRQVVK